MNEHTYVSAIIRCVDVSGHIYGQMDVVFRFFGQLLGLDISYERYFGAWIRFILAIWTIQRYSNGPICAIWAKNGPYMYLGTMISSLGCLCARGEFLC